MRTYWITCWGTVMKKPRNLPMGRLPQVHPGPRLGDGEAAFWVCALALTWVVFGALAAALWLWVD